MRKESTDKTIVKLKASPLFYLFLAYRELFHSNFWFWLSALNQDETLALFTNLKSVKGLSFKREHNQQQDKIKSKVDLLIKDGNMHLVAIENKVKDFPSKAQLDRIVESFKGASPEFIITTLFWSAELSFPGWKVRTYRQISDAIVPEKFSSKEYHRLLIRDYREFLSNLALLAESLPIGTSYDFALSFQKELFSQLNEIKLWEGYQKMRASHLLYHFDRSLKTADTDVKTSYGINNQKVTINFSIDLNDEYSIGIQIEDNQYRRFVAGPKHEKFAENLRVNDVFFNSKWLSPRKKNMMGYNPNFKYQYDKIEKPVMFDALFLRIKDDLNKIVRMRKDILKRIPL